MTDLAALVVRMQADNSQYIKALDQAAAKLKSHAAEQNETLKEIATRIGEAFAVEKIAEFAASAIEGAASLEKMSQSAGISVEALSALRLAAAASGLSQDDLGVALKKLNVNLSDAAGNASGKAGRAFNALGIEVKNSNGQVKDASVILSEVAGKFANLADGPNKTALAVALFGKQGQNLIAILNQGADGLKRYKEQAEALGIVISGKLAAAAEEFSQKAAVLKASIVDGLGVQLATQLLPVLNELADQFAAAGTAGETLSQIAGVIVGAIKIVAAVVIEAVSEVEQFGKSLGALGAIAVALAHGQVAEAAQIWRDSSNENAAIAKSAEDRIAAILETGTANELSIISTAEAEKKRIRAEAPNLAESTAMDAAIKKLEQLRDGIKDTAQAYGLGGAALERFKLTTGALADDVAKAGKDGIDLKNSIIAWATELERKKDSKTVEDYTAKIVEQIVHFHDGALAAEQYKLSTGAIGEALKRLGVTGENAKRTITALSVELLKAKDEAPLQALQDEADKLAGKLNKAALAAFDLQHKALKEGLTDTNDTEGLVKLEHAREYVDAQSKINELNLKAAEINTDLATAESQIALARARGQISDITAGNQEAAVRAHAIDQLGQIYNQEKDIAAAANDPALVDGVKKFGISIDQLQVQMTQFENGVRQGLEQSFAHNFADLITGAKTFKQAIMGFLQDIDKQFADMIAKDYAQKLFAGASGSSSGGALGGLAGTIAGLLGGGTGGSTVPIASTGAAATGTDLNSLASSLGGYADGGTIAKGRVSVVGEHGPELAYSGSRDLQIVPMGSQGGGSNPVTVTNHFTIQAPGGTISRQSQMQTAAAAARSLSQANRRNNG